MANFMSKNLSAMWETRIWYLSWEDPLEKKMATHSSISAWRISSEEPGRLLFMGLQRVRYNWATNTFIFTFHSVQPVNEELEREAHVGLSWTDRNWLQRISAFSVSLCNWLCLQAETPLCVGSGHGHWVLSGCSPVDAQGEEWEYLSSLLPVCTSSRVYPNLSLNPLEKYCFTHC